MILPGNKYIATRSEVDLYLEFTGFLKFRHVTLALQRATRSQKHILVIAIDIFDPVGEPGHRFIMDYAFPVPRHVGDRNRNTFANVKGDILWANAELFRKSVVRPPRSA